MGKALVGIRLFLLALFCTPAVAQVGFVGVDELTSEAAQKEYGVTLPAAMWCWEEIDGSDTPIRCNESLDGLHMRVGTLTRNVLDWAQIAANTETDGRWVDGAPDAQIIWGLNPLSYFGERRDSHFTLCARGFAPAEHKNPVQPHVANCFSASLTPASPLLQMWFYRKRWTATGMLVSDPPTVGEFEATVGYFSRQVHSFN